MESERDDTAKLQLQIEAYACRTSTLQARLLVTLDALDAIRAANTVELVDLERRNRELLASLDQYALYVNGIEAERDDLRDAVLQLIAKVEHGKDFVLWAGSSIQMTGLSDSAKQLQPTTEWQGDIAYASMLLTTLKASLADEQRSHAATRKCLRETTAKLALREAELAACTAHMDHSSLLGARLDSSAPRTGSSERLSPHEAFEILRTTSSLNNILEAEVDRLVNRLNQFVKRKHEPKTVCSPSGEAGPVLSGRADAIDSTLDKPAPQAELACDIQRLDAAIGGVTRERQILSEVLAQSTEHAPGPLGSERSGLDIKAMLEELQVARSTSIAREWALRLDIDRLQVLLNSTSLDPTSSLHNSPPLEQLRSPPEDALMNTSTEGERSMELETPLVGTISLPGPPLEMPRSLPSGGPSAHVMSPEPSRSPDLPFLPSSPSYSPHSLNSASPTLFRSHSPIPVDPGSIVPPATLAKEHHLRGLERQLQAAREDLEVKDAELHDLRQVMHNLRAQLAGGTQYPDEHAE